MTTLDPDDRLARLAAKQHGVFTIAQAREVGLSRSARRHRLTKHDWHEVSGGVYRLRGAPVTWSMRLFAAVATIGASAAASHRAAAQLYGIPGFTENWIEVTAKRGAHSPYRTARLHATRMPASHVRLVDNIPTTSVARTLFDLAGVLHPGRTERALDNCLAHHLLTPEAAWRVYHELASSGRAGGRIFRQLLEARGSGYVAPASELERLFLEIVAAANLPIPKRELNVGDSDRWIGRVEFVYPEARLLIEIDGRLYHTALLDRAHDRDRDNALMAAGWRVLRIDYEMLTKTPDRVAQLVRRALRAG